MVRKALPSFRATRQKRGKSDPGGISTMHGATDASEQHPESSQGRPGSLQDAPRTFPKRSWSPKGVPGAFRTLPGRFRDGPGAVSGLPRTVPRRLFRAPGPFRSLPGRFRMILDRSKLPQNDFSSIFRRILDVFSSIWARLNVQKTRFQEKQVQKARFQETRFEG